MSRACEIRKRYGVYKRECTLKYLAVPSATHFSSYPPPCAATIHQEAYSLTTTARVCYRYASLRPDISISMHFSFPRKGNPLLRETTRAALADTANINTRVSSLLIGATPICFSQAGVTIASAERVLNLIPWEKGVVRLPERKRWIARSFRPGFQPRPSSTSVELSRLCLSRFP